MECLHFLNSKGPFFFVCFHGKLATPELQDCQLNKQITFISFQLPWKSNGVLSPPPEAQHNWIFLVNAADWNVIRQNRVVVGVKGMGKGWRILGSGYSKNKCLLTVQHSGGQSRFKPVWRGGGRPGVLPPQPELVVLKGQRLACVWMGSFWERGASERAPGSCLPLARSLARAPSHRETGSHTICHLAPPAVSHAWPQPQHGTKWFQESGRDSGHLKKKRKKEINRHCIIIQATLKPLEKLEEAAYSLGKGTTPKIFQDNIMKHKIVQDLTPCSDLCMERRTNIYYLPCLGPFSGLFQTISFICKLWFLIVPTWWG